jgi:hypothetical protein
MPARFRPPVHLPLFRDQTIPIQNVGIRGARSTGLPTLNVELGFGPLEALLDSGAVRCLTPAPFRVGDQVWLRNFPTSKADRRITAKLSPTYIGPYKIAEFTTPVSVRLTDSATGARFRAHVSQLKVA